ncbi:MAG: tetratricopeptide repeat protein [Phaeodactylibacter sp.]|nr:tetratricopeptide repeat protein [Phaeodactylibacter sp.]MCB9047841.1 tetratricopeptide repeat protein [Lewinellaceae bacterium]
MKTKIGIIGLAIGLAFVTLACGGNSQDGQAGETAAIMTTGNPAIDGLSAEISENPNDAGLYAERGRLFYENDGFDEAIRDLNKALTLDSTNVDYMHLLADVYLDYFQSRRALKTMERAAELYPERIPTLLKLSEFQLILKQYEGSMKTIDRILKIDPQSADAYFMFGMNFKERGDTVRAINSFQKAVEFNSDLVDGWIQLGQLYAAIGDPLAMRYFDNAIRVAPENIYALHSRADYLSDVGNLAEAVEMYRRISRIDPQYEEAYFNSGLIYMDLDSIEQARRQFDIAIKTSPTHIRAYYYRGLAQEMLGNTAAAKADYEQALRMAPNYEKAQEALDRIKGAG